MLMGQPYRPTRLLRPESLVVEPETEPNIAAPGDVAAYFREAWERPVLSLLLAGSRDREAATRALVQVAFPEIQQRNRL